MKVLIATPAYGGQVTAQFAYSLQMTAVGLARDGITHGVLMRANESLVQRARNWLANRALTGGWDKLFFIDADLEWSYEEFRAILDSEAGVVAGTYPIKAFPIRLNFNLEDDAADPAIKTPEGFARYAASHADDRGEIPVRHAPTGFMAIHRRVLEALSEVVETYESDLFEEHGEKMFNFFDVGVRNGRLLSEDWTFCENCAAIGEEVKLNTNVALNHHGAFMFPASG